MHSVKKIIFVGGIHGVGKGTFCNRVSNLTNLVHLSSSSLIKWTEISSIENKKVIDINKTQERLVLGLEKATNQNNKYLLDGHFCLLDKENSTTNVPLKTFKRINPKGIIILQEDVNIIYRRLSNRDNLSYPLEVLSQLQKKEISRAKEVALRLKIELFTYNNNFDDALNFINNTL